MQSLTIRLKLYLLIVCSVVALGSLGVASWLAINRIGDAMHTIIDKSLAGVNALAALRVARVELSAVVLEGATWRPDRFDSVMDKDVALEDGQYFFSDIIERVRSAEAKAQEAFSVYDVLPRDEQEEVAWATVKELWEAEKAANERHWATIDALTQEVDWLEYLYRFDTFSQSTQVWSSAVKVIYPALDELIVASMESAEISGEAGDESISTAGLVIGGVSVLALLVVTLLGVTIARSIIKSLDAMRKTIVQIAATNDFTMRSPALGNDEAAQTARALNELLDCVQQSLRHIMADTGTIGSASGHAMAISSKVAGAATSQSELAISMAASVEEMTVSIGHIAESSKDALDRSYRAGNAASAGAETIERTATEMEMLAQDITRAGERVRELSRESERISGIVSVITEVAGQTNLLALNAAIEAARAGQEGSGFAVVADEVRKLAERTEASAREIGEKVVAIQEAVRSATRDVDAVVARAQSGRKLSEEAAGCVAEIRDGAARVSASVEAVVAALAEQEKAAEEISRRIDVVARVSEENCAAGGSVASVSRDLDAAAQSLRSTVDRFRV